MIGKVFGWVLGTVVILTFGVFAFFGAIQGEVSTLNATYPAGGNYTGLNEMIHFTPLLLVVGVISVPLVCILIYKYYQSTQG